MNKFKLGQRILLCVCFIGMVIGESTTYASMSFTQCHSAGIPASACHQQQLYYAYETKNKAQMTTVIKPTNNQTYKTGAQPATKKATTQQTTKPKATKSNGPSVAVLAPTQSQVIRTVKVVATGYTAGYESTGKNPSHPQYGITYSGVKVKRDKNRVSTIAADPKVFPLGSILYIPGYGYGIVADTGSAIKGQKIDLYFATTKQVYKEWGKKDVEVQVIKRGNGKCTEKMLQSLGKAIETYKTLPASVLEKTI